MKRHHDIPIGWIALAAALGFCGVFVAMSPATALTVRGVLGPLAGCTVKGNISIGSGERIYHVPGQHDSDETVIRYEFGERYFCSEADARAAGWRRSGI